jgi:hypothetical protein
MSELDREPEDWFQEAARWYSENHQGCPWCLGANRVYKSNRGNVTEYRCGSCEFLAFHDKGTGRYFMGPGKEGPAPATMHAVASLGSILSIKK